MEGGLDGVVIDWENRQKDLRQSGYDTQINHDSLEDLRRIKSLCKTKIVCRINARHAGWKKEIEAAIEGGADEILLPMVRKVEEVSEAFSLSGGHFPVGILLETEDALRHARALAELPLARVYVGFNDLAIDRKQKNIFRVLLEDTLDEIRPLFRCPFGFAGLTLPEFGDPIPCELLMGEMARLDCSFSFLRRSFLRDSHDKNLAQEIQRIKASVGRHFSRSQGQVQQDRKSLREIISRMES